jgi:Flp pilus assembly protein TadG
VIPIFLLIIVAMFDLGMFVVASNDISNAARKGARVAIVDQSVGIAENAAIQQATALGLTAGDVDVTYKTADLAGTCAPVALDCIAEVTVRYEWRPIAKSVLLLGAIFPNPITVASTTRMPVERIYP